MEVGRQEGLPVEGGVGQGGQAWSGCGDAGNDGAVVGAASSSVLLHGVVSNGGRAGEVSGRLVRQSWALWEVWASSCTSVVAHPNFLGRAPGWLSW